jgi:class 3 adenylate cyclase
MAEELTKRKLTAILSADVKGYSRLMEEDEETTIRTITEYKEIITRQATKSSIALLKNGIVEINERPD